MEVIIGKSAEEVTYISAEIPKDEQDSLIKVLKEFKHLFAWNTS